jgi:hypothetical protein
MESTSIMNLKHLPAFTGMVISSLIIMLWGSVVSATEEARYQVIESHDTIELRDYLPMIVAETQTTGDRETAIKAGFRIIADYIFGNNQPERKVEMTAPVIQQASQKIPMTAPVLQQSDNGRWDVRFVMPASFTMATLPRPNNPLVTLRQISAHRYAVIRFSGWASTDSLKEETDTLMAFVRARQLNMQSSPIYGFYDPPWTLPFLRRNEVMVEVAR